MQPDYHQREVPAIHFPRLHFHITTRPGSAVMMSPGKQEEGDVEKGGDVERKGGERGRETTAREEEGERKGLERRFWGGMDGS